MPNKKDCMELIAQTLSSASDPESAYVVRARLHRSLLMVGRWIADDFGCPLPVLSDDLLCLAIKDAEASKIMHLCNNVLAQSRSLCQPSESLEHRWRNGWSQVVKDLASLEVALIDYKRI